jgi:capsular polysaccharide export protein
MTRRVLLLHNTPKARRYFKALQSGIPELDILTAPVGIRWHGPGKDLPADCLGQVCDYTMRRKWARERIPDWRLRALEHSHRRVARWHINDVWRRMESLQPDAVAVWGGQSVDVASALFVADRLGIQRYVFECGLLPNTTTCDPLGVNADNSVPRSPQFYAQYNKPAAWPRSLLPRPSRRAVDPAQRLPKRYIFIPLQVRLDSQVLLYSPWIRNMRHLVQVVLEAARDSLQHSDVELVFKRHPSCTHDYADLERLFKGLPYARFADGNSTQELIDKALAVVTINSTVGLESLLLNRPVVALGRACYAIPGVAAQARSVPELAQWMRMADAEELPVAPHREAFLNYLVNEYCIPTQHKAPTQAHLRAMAQRLATHPGAVRQAQPAPQPWQWSWNLG